VLTSWTVTAARIGLPAVVVTVPEMLAAEDSWANQTKTTTEVIRATKKDASISV
jgi:hypothetical protein